MAWDPGIFRVLIPINLDLLTHELELEAFTGLTLGTGTFRIPH
jgi:hypothetical protein